MAYGLENPNIVGSYLKGYDIGAQELERKRKAPIMEQLEQLTLRRQEQAIKSGERQITLQDLQIADNQRKAQQSALVDLGNAAQWADTPQKWEQALDFYEAQGGDVSKFRGRYDLRDTMLGLQNPNASAQQQALQNLQSAIESGDVNRIRAASLPLAPEKVIVESIKSPYSAVSGKGREGYVLDSRTGKMTIDPGLKQQLAENVQQNLEFKDLRSLNSDMSAILNKPKAMASAASSLEALESSASPTDQIAAVFMFMKTLDPSSTVKETEQGQVYSAEGAAKGLAATLNAAIGKGGLSKENFRNMVDTARRIANSAIDSADTEAKAYLGSYGNALSQDDYSRQLGRIPKRFNIGGSTANMGEQNSAFRAKFDALPEAEKQSFLQRATPEMKARLGL